MAKKTFWKIYLEALQTRFKFSSLVKSYKEFTHKNNTLSTR